MVGGGPAGAATAITLQKLGINCTVLNSAREVLFKPGESLSPNARGVLHELGVAHLPEASAHLRYTGNTTVWGNDTPAARYFFAEPFGDGWHLDRLFFERQLKEEACRLGAEWHEEAQFVSLGERDGMPWVNARSAGGKDVSMPAAFVIDSSGRSSVVARKADSIKRTIDSLAAYCFLLDMPAADLNGITFVEAVPDGWWYAAPLPQNQVAVNFMSDSDLHKVTKEGLSQWLAEKLNETLHLQDLLKVSGPAAIKHAMVKTATTSLLLQPAGARWLAVGDALCTYDPLTSFGITIAMAGGRQVAIAVAKFLDGDFAAIREYMAMQQDTFNSSLAMLQSQYGLEHRWPDQPFWQRRQ